MDIKVTSTGKVFYQIDNAIAALLMEAFPASFERVERPAPAPAPAVTKWGIGTALTSGQHYIQGICDKCNQTFRIVSGTEAQIRTQRFSHCGRNEQIPEHVLAEYLRVRTPISEMPVEYYRAARAKEEIQK